jgi:hypothetical protein
MLREYIQPKTITTFLAFGYNLYWRQASIVSGRVIEFPFNGMGRNDVITFSSPFTIVKH